MIDISEKIKIKNPIGISVFLKINHDFLIKKVTVPPHFNAGGTVLSFVNM